MVTEHWTSQPFANLVYIATRQKPAGRNRLTLKWAAKPAPWVTLGPATEAQRAAGFDPYRATRVHTNMVPAAIRQLGQAAMLDAADGAEQK